MINYIFICSFFEKCAIMVKSIHYYVKDNGKSPFLEWVNDLDMTQQVIVDRYIQRITQGGRRKVS